MAIDIKHIVKTNFSIESRAIPIGSYKHVLFVSTPSQTKNANAVSSDDSLEITFNQSTFLTQISTDGTYVFTYDGENWKNANNETITLATYGITISSGTPAQNDTITVTVSTTYEDSANVANAKILYKALGCDETCVDVLNYTPGAVSLPQAILDRKKSVSGTENDFIFVVIDPSYNQALISTEADIIAITEGGDNFTDSNKFNSPYKVILCMSMTASTYTLTYETITNNHPVAIKLVPDTVSSAPLGMCVAAYYSKINLNEDLSLQDYCYTDESAVYQTLEKYNSDNAEYIAATMLKKYPTIGFTDSEYKTYVNTTNFTDIVGNSIVDFGGNLTNGVSITAYYGMITSDNDIIFAVLGVMLNKQYLTSEGLNNVVAAINASLERYTHNGYLEQNSQYLGNTYSESYNGITSTLIKQGASLPTGYYVATIPMSRLSLADRKAHKFTPIRVFLQTQAGARVVEINGTVIE